jgi:hypothetical protein
VYKPFLLVWGVEMLVAEISCPCKLNQGDSKLLTQMQGVRTIEALPACMLWGPLVPFRKNFETLSKQNHGTLWEHSGNTLGTPNLPGLVNNALHYTLGTHVHKPQACSLEQQNSKYKRNSFPKFFLYDLVVSKLYA